MVEKVELRLLGKDSLGEKVNKKEDVSFFETLKKEIESLNETVKRAELKAVEVATGRSDDILGAVVAMTEAELAVKMAVQVRNKVAQVYQTFIHMQV